MTMALLKKAARRVLDYVFSPYLGRYTAVRLGEIAAVDKMMQLALIVLPCKICVIRENHAVWAA
jgi:hypothetical protein